MKQSSKASFQMLFKVYCCANTCLHKSQTKVKVKFVINYMSKDWYIIQTETGKIVHENEDTTTTSITGDRKYLQFFCISHVSTPKVCSTLSLDFYCGHNKITKLQKDWNYPYSTLRVCLHCGQFSNLISIPKKDDPLKIVSTYIPCTISAKKNLEPPFDSGSSKRRNTTCLS